MRVLAGLLPHTPLPPPVAICTRSELEDFLSEAVCMKEFDHPNVMRLIGERGALMGFVEGMRWGRGVCGSLSNGKIGQTQIPGSDLQAP